MEFVLELAVCAFSIATGCLAAVCMANQFTIATILMTVASFLLVLIQMCRFVVRRRLLDAVSIVGALFYLACGVVFILKDVVDHRYQKTQTIPLVVVFVVNIMTWGASTTYFRSRLSPEIADDEKHVQLNTKIESDEQSQASTEVPDINKKCSEKTLVHGPAYSNNSSEITIPQAEEYVNEDKIPGKEVKRSKSTPVLTSKQPTSRKSIEHEKVFLRSVSQSLLPSVLKQGESPILVLKRQQMKFEETTAESEKNSINLPYIDEFGEEAVHFPDFDQAEITTEQADKYMNGLAIPQSRSQPLWKLETRCVSGGQVNHISHDTWSSHSFLEHRTRSGGNLAAGSSRNYKLRNNSSATLALDDADATFLLPGQVSNIDSLSDLSSARPVLYRSMSAPSLHTFRKVSSNEVPQITEQKAFANFDFGTVDLTRVCTPTTPINGPTGSPFRRFIKESPKRLTSVFKKRLMDLTAGPSHKHSTSVISQFSMASSKSSPRKSIKSLFSGNAAGMQTHRSQASMPAFTLPALVAKGSEPIDFWNIDTAPSSEGPSRVSSVPSDVIGAYDREKWRTLKLFSDETLEASEHYTIEGV